jgi:CDP-paratose 2-epimerase
MGIAIVTGSGGLVGSAVVEALVAEGFDVVGLEADVRASLFGPDASTRRVTERLVATWDSFRSLAIDIRDAAAVEDVFREYRGTIELVAHTAAQPSHDWSATAPLEDFAINATATLALLEAVRTHAPGATFAFTSTNKVYGDAPNRLPLEERETRLDLPAGHPFFDGIDTTMSIDRTLRSPFGASKTAADVMVQEYGRYYGLATVCFRCGCVTGSNHAGAELHGFLSYLARCTVRGEPYTVHGYGGKQVRDNIHAADVASAMLAFHARPTPGAVYNLGGGRSRSCSVLEAIALCEAAGGRSLAWTLAPTARRGDHRWWISDLEEFRRDYPAWTPKHDLDSIVGELCAGFAS